MKNDDFIRAIGEIKEDFIIEAKFPKKSYRKNKVNWFGFVACLCVLIAAGLFMIKPWVTSTINSPNTVIEQPGTSSNISAIPSVSDTPATDLSYKKSDYYLIALTLNNEKPTIDFNVLFDELLIKPVGIDNPDYNDYIEANKDAYNKLLSYGNETIFYCSCYVLQNWKEYKNDTDEMTKARLAFEILLKMIATEPYDNPYIEDSSDSSLDERQRRLINFTVARWNILGTESFRETAPGLYQLIRAMTSVPDYRFLITDFEGQSYNEYVSAQATEMFIWVFNPSIAWPEYRADLPAAPEGVCNENTSWVLSQDQDGSIILTFRNASDGTYIGKMVYHPKPEELEGPTTGIFGSVEVNMK